MTTAQSFELLQERLRPVARGIARHREWHELLLEWLVGRPAGDIGDVHREAARCTERRHPTVRIKKVPAV